MTFNDSKYKLTTLFSETDLHGTIIFVNDAFCQISKYSRTALIGMPHNIIRHPDMPRELFTIMWSTIQKGNIFRGVIKNRASDSSHYWVNATVMPTKNQKGEIEKYIAVRHLISDEKSAQELFDLQAKSMTLGLF